LDDLDDAEVQFLKPLVTLREMLALFETCIQESASQL
jgi:hypothetical protein